MSASQRVSRFRLNGWQRIGILLSVIWFFVGAWWGLKELYDPIDTMYRLCLALTSSGTETFASCSEEFHEGYAAASEQSLTYILGFGLLPIPIAWLLVYIVVWIVRWVRRGFQPSRTDAA